MLNIISRSLVAILVSTTLSACSSKAPAGASNPDLSAAPDLRMAVSKTPQSVAEAKTTAPVADTSIPPEEKRRDDKLENSIIASENSVYFSFGKTEIDNSGMILLRRNAIRLRENPQQVVTLVAFTDNLGSRSLNLAIAEERMTSVVATLHALGVPKKQIRRRSAGLSKLSSACSTQACRQMMRRVELVYE